MEKKQKVMKWVIIAAIIIIPVMYSFFYLKAFWDPYGSLQGMKIAMVNLDEGENDENLGKELVNQVKEKDVMTILELNDADEAQKGLVNQEYYATITIPKDFTKTLNQAENADRQMTTITYSPNQKSNYLASQIVAKVVTTVETELRGQISQKVVAKLSDKLREVPDKMQDISQGANQLEKGSTQLSKGLETLQKGTDDLNSNYMQFDKGVESAYQGSKELQSGMKQLTTGADKIYAGTNQLANRTKDLSKVTDGVKQLSSGASNLSSGVTAYVDGVNTAINGVTTVTNQVQTLGKDLQNYVASNPSVMADPNFQKVMKDLQNIQKASGNTQGLATITAKGKELKQGANTLNQGIQSFASQTGALKELSSGVQTLHTGMLELKQGLNNAQTGSDSLTTGLGELSTNSKKVQEGITQLNNASQTALEGSKTLTEGTQTFQSEINQGIEDTKEQVKSLDGLDEYVKEPVTIEEVDYAQVDSYGVGFAPYFMSISLWVGGLIMLVMLYNDPEDKYKLMGKNAKNKFLRTVLYLTIAGVQGIVLGFLLKLGLGFSVTNIALYYGTCVLISMMFTSIILFLIVNLGDVGKFICILLLVLQLAASGGTFPIETVPKFFQSLYPFMPMNYTIRLIKESLIKEDSGMILQNAWIVLGIAVVFIGATIGFDWIRMKKKQTKNEN